ncbi:MAG: hypothetical protein LBL67_00160 [Coriobacteriales bacterium]|jgi:cytochrome bd-type quinol oxidase subunit 2|nr:hypothetical protein [Coriobacteriales bacterium]
MSPADIIALITCALVVISGAITWLHYWRRIDRRQHITTLVITAAIVVVALIAAAIFIVFPGLGPAMATPGTPLNISMIVFFNLVLIGCPIWGMIWYWRGKRYQATPKGNKVVLTVVVVLFIVLMIGLQIWVRVAPGAQQTNQNWAQNNGYGNLQPNSDQNPGITLIKPDSALTGAVKPGAKKDK